MSFNLYADPGAARLLESGRIRWCDQPDRRLIATEATGAALFLAGAIALAGLGHGSALNPVRLAYAAITFLVAARVVFPVGSGHTKPTQVAFVPMLFLVPVRFAPLVVAGCLILDLWPQALARELSIRRACSRVADCAYSLGPVAVLMIAGVERFSWTEAPIIALALLAQFAVDATAGIARDWFAEGTPPSSESQLLWLYATDICLSCVGLIVAGAAVTHPAVILLVIPLLALLGMFALERRHRLDGSLELSTAYRGTALLLGDVVEGDHQYTGVHSREVVDLSLATSDVLGLDPEARRRVEFAALLHDVGKLRIPKAIIDKPGRLDAAEWEMMRRHTIEGEALLRRVGGLLARVGAIVRASHEHFNGGGYPDGLAGEGIPIEARIVAACDAYSAMTAERSYRRPMSADDAIAELRRCSGTQFDPRVVHALIGCVAPVAPARPLAAIF